MNTANAVLGVFTFFPSTVPQVLSLYLLIDESQDNVSSNWHHAFDLH